MGLISRRVCHPRFAAKTVLAAALFLVWGGILYAQNALPGQVGTEVRNLERKLTLAGISPAERYDTLVRLARLRQLSGNISGAAASWLEASAANPGDAGALVSGVYCLVAIGEWEKAAAVLRPLLASGGWGPSMLRARYLDAALRAWSSLDASALTALASDPGFITLRPQIYYTLWQTVNRIPGIRGAGSAEQWKTRLIAEFPRSPEARVVNPSAGNATSVSAVQSPLWLLLPEMIATAVEVPPAPIPAIPSPPPPPVTAVPPLPSVPPPSAQSVAPVPPAAAPSPGVVLQTGLFGREANARTQSEALRRAGFTANITRKLVNGAEHWAVTVPAGQDAKKTAQELKTAGFDCFPTSL